MLRIFFSTIWACVFISHRFHAGSMRVSCGFGTDSVASFPTRVPCGFHAGSERVPNGF